MQNKYNLFLLYKKYAAQTNIVMNARQDLSDMTNRSKMSTKNNNSFLNSDKLPPKGKANP